MKRILAILLSALMLTSLAVFSAAGEAASSDMTVVGYQVSSKPTGADAADTYYALRLIAAHANIVGYSSFGYDVTVGYTDLDGKAVTKTLTEPKMSNTVYKKLNAGADGEIQAETYNVEYISAIEITDIPTSAGDLTVTVTPIVVYNDARGRTEGTPQTFTHDLTVTTMTFNIHNWDTDAAHLKRIKQSVKSTYPDVIGFQEMSNQAGYKWVDQLLADTDIAATYAYFGQSCGDSTGEQCAIFYNKNKFELVEDESGTRWLYCAHGVTCTKSDCMGSTVAGNFESTETTYYRVMTYVTLRYKSDPAKELVFINTHLDLYTFAASAYGNSAVQNKQIDYILNFAKTLTDAGTPVILMGDFNARDQAFGTLFVTPGSTVFSEIEDAGFVRAEDASAKIEGGEVTGYNGEGKKMSPGIDHIFIHAQSLYLLKYTFCDDKIEVNGVADYPSDHIPRIAEYAFW